MSQESSTYATYPSLRDRVVAVTGGATGIGEHIVEHFAHQGSRVAFLDIQDEASAHLIASLKDVPTPPIYIHCDVTDIAALAAAINDIAARLGTIDVLVNNAGNDTRHATEDVTPEYWDRCTAINLRQQFFAIQAVIPIMKRAGRGSIVNLSSISWLIPGIGLPVYIASKAGVVGLTKTLAHELGPHNIRVNAVLPGAIATERQRRLWYTEEYKAEILHNQALKRILTPEEVARLILFLVADDSSAITSQGYIIDGGWV
ncbi:MAG: SDR family oxidoreductase [Silvibacterium sp.]|nr:SDR family oxidoreductase [Silvibacterium sp.]MBV8436092.1 SDR family oxidoreductase [Silvibacterium sp.]